MRRHRKYLHLGLLSFSITASSWSQNHAYPSISNMVDSGATMVVGTASTTQTGQHSYGMNLTIKRIVQASDKMPSTLTLSIEGDCVNPAVGEITALWFLTKNETGTYALSENFDQLKCTPLQSPLEMPTDAVPSDWAPARSDLKDKLASEIAWSVDQHQGNGPMMVIINPAFLDDASVATRAKLGHRFLASSNENEHRIGLISLLKDGDPQALQEIRNRSGSNQVADGMPSFLQLRGERIPLGLEGRRTNGQSDPWLGMRLSQIIDTDATVQKLLIEILSTATDQSIRIGAANALAAIHSSLAVSALIPYLSSEVAELRYAVIGGIACYVDAVPVIDPKAKYGGFDLNRAGPYKTDDTALHFAFGASEIKKREDYYRQFWIDWAAAHLGS